MSPNCGNGRSSCATLESSALVDVEALAGRQPEERVRHLLVQRRGAERPGAAIGTWLMLISAVVRAAETEVAAGRAEYSKPTAMLPPSSRLKSTEYMWTCGALLS